MANLFYLLAQAGGTGAAPAAAPAGAQQGPNMLGMLPFYLLIFAAMYFLLIRPQQKQKKEQAKMLSEIKTGDKVVTAGGVHGVIANIKEKTYTLRMAEGKMEVDKSAVVRVTEKGSGSGEA